MTLQRIQQPDIGRGVKKDAHGWLFHRPRFLRGPRTERPFDAPMLITERLTLRPHDLKDTESWFEVVSDAATIQHLPWKRRDRAEAAEHLGERTQHTRLWQSGDFLALAIERDGQLVGDVSVHLRDVELEDRSVEIGWLLHPAHSGHGYATEAADALIEYLKTIMKARWIYAVMDEDNTASFALATRLGFVETACEGGSRTTVLDLS